ESDPVATIVITGDGWKYVKNLALIASIVPDELSVPIRACAIPDIGSKSQIQVIVASTDGSIVVGDYYRKTKNKRAGERYSRLILDSSKPRRECFI
ncbi:MAG: hypothetical protein KDD60_12695, partial [Bdellovibrionales bacterium]|nr:hypothetical protein [Bdellovibrionales bacterium]